MSHCQGQSTGRLSKMRLLNSYCHCRWPWPCLLWSDCGEPVTQQSWSSIHGQCLRLNFPPDFSVVTLGRFQHQLVSVLYYLRGRSRCGAFAFQACEHLDGKHTIFGQVEALFSSNLHAKGSQQGCEALPHTPLWSLYLLLSFTPQEADLPTLREMELVKTKNDRRRPDFNTLVGESGRQSRSKSLPSMFFKIHGAEELCETSLDK